MCGRRVRKEVEKVGFDIEKDKTVEHEDVSPCGPDDEIWEEEKHGDADIK